METTRVTIRVHLLRFDESFKASLPKGHALEEMDHAWGLEVDNKIAPVGPHEGMFASAEKARSYYLKKMQPEGQQTVFKTIVAKVT
jgi:hypothetical protein